MKTHRIPRTQSEYPMWIALPPEAPIPARMRDDLDPYDPPAEYPDGRVSWRGYPTREARDAARVERARQRAIDVDRRRRERETAREKLAAQLRGQAWRRIKAGGLVFARSGDVSSFACAVSREENRAAHGNVCITEYANDAPHVSRSVNVNGTHREEGPWEADEQSIASEVDQQLPPQ